MREEQKRRPYDFPPFKAQLFFFFIYTLELCSLSHIGDAFVNLRTLQKE